MRAALSRHRRLLAAVFAAAAAALALTATRAHPKGVRVLVAARDLSAGAVLGGRDVAVRVLPPDSVPAGVVRRATGRALSRPGTARRATDGRPAAPERPLPDGRLRPDGLLEPADPAAVAVPVRLADAAVARLLHRGDHVDVLAARADPPSRPAQSRRTCRSSPSPKPTRTPTKAL